MFDASRGMKSNGGGVLSISSLASFRGGDENDDVYSLAPQLFQVTD